MSDVFKKQYLEPDDIHFTSRLNNTISELKTVQTKYNNYRTHIKQKMEHIFNNVI